MIIWEIFAEKYFFKSVLVKIEKMMTYNNAQIHSKLRSPFLDLCWLKRYSWQYD